MGKDANVIYDDTIVKYTINIPLDLYAKITQKSHGQKVHRSVWIRHVIENQFVNERPATMTELKRLFKEGDIFECPDPPRRFHGFLGGLGNSFKLNWFMHKRHAFLETKNN